MAGVVSVESLKLLQPGVPSEIRAENIVLELLQPELKLDDNLMISALENSTFVFSGGDVEVNAAMVFGRGGRILIAEGSDFR